MSRLWIGFVAAYGVVAGTVLVGQLGKAAEPAPGSAAGGRTNSSQALSAAGPLRQQRASAGTADTKPPEEPLTVLKSDPDHVRVVYRVKNCPATSVNQEVQQLLRLEGGFHKLAATSAKGTAGSSVAIVPCVVENSLLISGAPEAVEEVRSLIDKLDQSPPMLLLEMEIGLVPVGEANPVKSPKSKEHLPAVMAELFRLQKRPENMETTSRARVIALDNQPAQVRMGSRVPRINAMSAPSTGAETRSITLDNVGLFVGVTARIAPDGAVVMLIDVEQGQVGPENEGIPIAVEGGKTIRSPRFETTTVATTVRIPNNQTVILGTIAQKGKSDKELVIIVTPHVITPEEAKKLR